MSVEVLTACKVVASEVFQVFWCKIYVCVIYGSFLLALSIFGWSLNFSPNGSVSCAE